MPSWKKISSLSKESLIHFFVVSFVVRLVFVVLLQYMSSDFQMVQSLRENANEYKYENTPKLYSDLSTNCA